MVEFRYPVVRIVQRYYSPTSAALVPVLLYSIRTIQRSTILSSCAAVPCCQKTQTLSTFTIITAEILLTSFFSLFCSDHPHVSTVIVLVCVVVVWEVVVYLSENMWYYLRSVPLVHANFLKGSHSVSFRSFSCRLRYIVHEDDGLRVLLSASVRGIIILSTKSFDAYVFVR